MTTALMPFEEWKCGEMGFVLGAAARIFVVSMVVSRIF